MNKKAIVALVIVIALLLVGYFFFSKKTDGLNPLTSIQSDKSDSPKSIKDLISSGLAQRCTFSSEVEGAKSEGVVYVSNSKMRNDFSSVVSGKTMMSHMIVDGNTSYMWTDGQKTGYKTSFDLSSKTETKETNENSMASNINPDVKTDFDCGVWIVDDSVFKAPSDITFMDFNIPSAAPQNGSSSSGSSSSCSYCQSLSGDSKSQCLTALGCK